MIPEINGFIDDVFRIFYDVQRANSKLLTIFNVRQPEQSLLIQRVGDIFLQVATEFERGYPPYVGHLLNAEKRLKEEAEGNNEFRLFLQVRPLFLWFPKRFVYLLYFAT